MPRPNILYLLADQWRAQALGYAGDADARTPRIDALARESVDLRQAVAGTPVCCPARASLLTGTYPDRHGIFLNDAPLDPTLPGLGKHLAAAGYDTAWIGKWHLDGHGRMRWIPAARHQGFAYWKALECTHDYLDSRYFEGDSPEPRVWPGYDADAQTDDLVAWLGARRGDRPFAAVLSWGPPHNPYETAPPAFRVHDPARLSLRANVDPRLERRIRGDLVGYYAHGGALDACAGRLLDCLDRLGIAGDTIVVFTSDHGDMIGSHGLWDKQCPWDEALRVPFLVRYPAALRPGASDVVIDAVDVLPTLCGLAGLPAPGWVQGRDLSPYLRDGDLPRDNHALYAHYHCFGNWPGQREDSPLHRARVARGLRTVDHLYVEDRDGPWLLYDLRADPFQLDNLVGRASASSLQAGLRRALHAKLAANGDRFTSGEELVAEWGYAVDERGTMSTAP